MRGGHASASAWLGVVPARSDTGDRECDSGQYRSDDTNRSCGRNPTVSE